MARHADLTGQRFGRLTVLREAEYFTKSGKRQRGYLCCCDCGNEKIASAYSLYAGKTKSCGCLIREFNSKRAQYYHHDQWGEDKKRISRIYNHMKQRCYNSNTQRYANYGGRGIRICDEWLCDRDAFIRWSLEHGYHEGLSIDRIDVNSDYCPENCRWVDKFTQANNTRANTYIYYNGERYTVTELSRILGIERHALSAVAKKQIELRTRK